MQRGALLFDSPSWSPPTRETNACTFSASRTHGFRLCFRLLPSLHRSSTFLFDRTLEVFCVRSFTVILVPIQFFGKDVGTAALWRVNPQTKSMFMLFLLEIDTFFTPPAKQMVTRMKSDPPNKKNLQTSLLERTPPTRSHPNALLWEGGSTPRGRSCNEPERQAEVRFARQWSPQELRSKEDLLKSTQTPRQGCLKSWRVCTRSVAPKQKVHRKRTPKKSHTTH